MSTLGRWCAIGAVVVGVLHLVPRRKSGHGAGGHGGDGHGHQDASTKEASA